VNKYLKKISNLGLFAFTFNFGEYQVTVPLPMRWSSGAGLELELRDLINLLIGLGSVVAVAMIIISGYTLITSTGNPDKVEQGQKTLTGAVIGLVIVWAAGLLIKTLLKGLGTI
jgi:type IV secretory pathway VirB2 component (pilin)